MLRDLLADEKDVSGGEELCRMATAFLDAEEALRFIFNTYAIMRLFTVPNSDPFNEPGIGV